MGTKTCFESPANLGKSKRISVYNFQKNNQFFNEYHDRIVIMGKPVIISNGVDKNQFFITRIGINNHWPF